MKTKFSSKVMAVMLAIIMVIALIPMSVSAAVSQRVDFCLTNGALENYVFFENNPNQYFISQMTKADGKLTYLEEVYRTDNLDLEFDGWYTEDGERITLDTVFTDYTIVYDRWKPSTLSDEDIISTLKIGTPMLKVGETAGSYANSISLTDDRLTVESVSVYEGLNAYRTSKLDDNDILESGKSYSLRVELHTKNGELIDAELMKNTTASYGLVANMLYSHDYSGIFTTQWTNMEDKIQVIINYDYENYYFEYDFEDKTAENGQSPQYTVYVSNNAKIEDVELFVENANGSWSSLGKVSGQFNIPANSNVTKRYRVDVTYLNGFVISSNTFRVDWYDPNMPKFVTQPKDYSVSYGENVVVTWGINFDSSAMELQRYNGENWVNHQSAYNTGATVVAMAESGTYTFRAHATKDGADYYSEPFDITWREKFEFTVQPQSRTVATGEECTITWEMSQTPTILQLYIERENGTYTRTMNLSETATSYTFPVSQFAYSQNYKLYASYDNVGYYSDAFTIEYVAGEFTSGPSGELNAVVGKDYLVEWDYSLDAEYFVISLYVDGEFDQYEVVYQPEHVFNESKAGNMQFFIQAYNAKNELISDAYLLFRINFTEEQIVYLVSFSANGGKGTMEAFEKDAGSTYILPECSFTAPDGKVFKGWSVNNVEKAVGDEITINANTIIKAIWEEVPECTYYYFPGEADGSADFDVVVSGTEITLAECMFEAPVGKVFKGWAVGDINAELKQPGEKIVITGETYIYAVWSGYTISGTVKSFNDGDATIELLKDGEVIDFMDTSSAYSFEDVTEGEYTLRVSKSKHATREYEVTVAGEDVIQDVEIWLYGDVTKDGNVNNSDVIQINRSINNMNSVFSQAADLAYRLKVANVTAITGSDIVVNNADAMQINRKINNMSSVFSTL